jgi:hypothetical protein
LAVVLPLKHMGKVAVMMTMKKVASATYLTAPLMMGATTMEVVMIEILNFVVISVLAVCFYVLAKPSIERLRDEGFKWIAPITAILSLAIAKICAVIIHYAVWEVKDFFGNHSIGQILFLSIFFFIAFQIIAPDLRKIHISD